MGTYRKKHRYKIKPWQRNSRINATKKFKLSGFTQFGHGIPTALPFGASTGVTGVSQFFKNLVRGNR